MDACCGETVEQCHNLLQGRMKKLLIPILLVAALTNNVFAAVRVISSTGTDSGDCTAPNSCATSAYAYGFTVGGDTVGWIPSATMYTSTGNSGADLGGIVGNTFPNHVSSYITLTGFGDPNVADGWGDVRFPTSCVIFNGYSSPFSVKKSSYIVIKNFYAIDSGEALPIKDSHHIKVMRVGVKNGTPHSAQYTAAASLNSDADAFQPSSSDCLFEDVAVIGEARYSVIVGGTVGFADHNVLRRVWVRWDGNNGNQPSAPISLYGATGGVDGVRNAVLQNCVVIDNNTSGFKTGGENIYGMIYFPHSATGIQIYDSIIFANGAGYGMIPGEDSASNNGTYNSLIFGQTGPGIFTNSASISSTTFRGNTIGWTSGAGLDLNGGSNYRFENNQYYRIGGGVDAATVDNYNGYFPSTSNPTGSTNEITTDPNMVVASSVNPSVAQYGGGLNGANVGATILYQRGVSGSLWGQSGWNDLQTDKPIFPYPYEAQIKALMAKADSGNALANNSSNVTTRGWAGTSVALADYTYNGVKLGFAAGAVQGGDGEPDPPAGTPQKLQFQGSINIRGVSFP